MIAWSQGGKQQRKNCHTADYVIAEKQAAQKLAELEAAAVGAPMPVSEDQRSLSSAVQMFVDLKKQDNITEKRVRLIKFNLMQFVEFCAGRGKVNTADVTTPDCTAYKASLTGHQNTKHKKAAAVGTFLSFCFDSQLISRNPFTAQCKVRKNDSVQRVRALDEKQFDVLLKAIPKVNGATTDQQRKMLYSIVMLMRYTGLAVRDAACIERKKFERFEQNGAGFYRVEVNRAKTGAAVFCVITEAVKDAIFSGALPEERYLFSQESLHEFDERQMDNYAARFGTLLTKLGIVADIRDEDGNSQKFTSHCLRHSFVAAMLNADVPTEDVALMIGDDLVTVARHYSEFITSRKRRLQDRMVTMLSAAEGK
jgi:site-specific recombinase XerD